MTEIFDEDVTLSTGSPLSSKRYVLKLVRLEVTDHAQYGPGIRWVTNVLDVDGGNVVIRDTDGAEYEFYQTSGTRLQAPAPGQKPTKAYKFASGFLGRPIAVGESGRTIAAELIGRKAEAFLAPNDNLNLAVMAIDPIGTNYPQFRASAKAAPAPEPAADLSRFEPDLAPAPEPVEALAF